MNINKVLRRIFGPKRCEVTEDWRKVHNEEFSELYSSPTIFRVNKSRRTRRAGHVARMGERGVAYRILMGKSEVNRPLQDSVIDGKRAFFKMNLQEVEWVGHGLY